jgi:hypothetical protein
MLRVYKADGTFVAEMGGSGSGPGEFQSINGIWVTPGSNVGVWDPRSRRITVFGPDGQLQSTHRVELSSSVGTAEAMAGNLEDFFGELRDGDILLGSLSFGLRPDESGETTDTEAVGRFASAGEFRRVITRLRGMRRRLRSPLPFTAIPFAATYRDSLVVTDGYDSNIRVLGPDGHMVRTIHLTAPRSNDGGTDPWALLAKELRQRKSNLLFLNLLKRMPHNARIPEIAGLLVDDRRRVWVKSYEPSADAVWLKDDALDIAPGGTWRILRRTGQALARLRMPDRFSPFAIQGDHILGVVHDSLGVESATILSIVHQ